MILSETQQMVRDTARTFAQERILPAARDWERARAFPPNILREMSEMGFLGMNVPESDGGAGLDYVSYALALTEIAAGDGALSTLMSVQNAPVCAVLVARGSVQQKRRYLAPLARGKMIGAFALTEPQAGSDAANLLTVARRCDGGYCIHGTKQFITSGAIAGLTITFAVTDADAGKRGISAFIVPAVSTGFSVARVESKLGQKGLRHGATRL